MFRKDQIRRPFPTVTGYWLIECDATDQSLTIDNGSEKMLPVFSFPEEAELFLTCEASEERWRLRRTSSSELFSLLTGPCSEIDLVALDPMPRQTLRGLIPLVSLSRERFLHRLAGEFRPGKPPVGFVVNRNPDQ